MNDNNDNNVKMDNLNQYVSKEFGKVRGNIQAILYKIRC